MFDNVFNHQGVIFKMIAGMIFALIKRPLVRPERLIIVAVSAPSSSQHIVPAQRLLHFIFISCCPSWLYGPF